MRALGDDPALLEHDDPVGPLHRREPVRDDQRRPPLGEPLDRLPAPPARSRRRARSSPRRAAGPARRAGSRGRWRCAASARPTASPRARRHRCRSPRAAASMKSCAAAARAAASTSASVASGRPKRMFSRARRREDHRVLRHQRQLSPQVGARHVAQVDAVQRHPPRVGIEEPHQELEDRGLARARRPDQRHRLARARSAASVASSAAVSGRAG